MKTNQTKAMAMITQQEQDEIKNCFRILDEDTMVCVNKVKQCLYNTGDNVCQWQGDDNDMAPFRPVLPGLDNTGHPYGCMCNKCLKITDFYYGGLY